MIQQIMHLFYHKRRQHYALREGNQDNNENVRSWPLFYRYLYSETTSKTWVEVLERNEMKRIKNI